MFQRLVDFAVFQKRINYVVAVAQVVAHDRNFFVILLNQFVVVFQLRQFFFQQNFISLQPLHVVKIFRGGQNVSIEEKENQRQINSRQPLRPRVNQNVVGDSDYVRRNDYQRQKRNVNSLRAQVKIFSARQKFHEKIFEQRKRNREQQKINRCLEENYFVRAAEVA